MGTVLAATACAGRGEGAFHDGQAIELGTVRLALETGDEGRYRLSAAVFEIRNRSGEVVATLRGDDEPSARALSVDLPQGDYTIELSSGWVLEAADEEGGFVPVQAALLTRNPLPFRVDHGRTRELGYSFTTVEGTITLGRGSLSVEIDVLSSAPLEACSVLDTASCASGLSCLLAGESGETFCAQPGSLPVGAECSSEQCVAGAQCLRESGQTNGVCQRFCDPNATNPICDCRSLSFDRNLGVCEGPPSCEPNCNAAQVFTFSDTFRDDIEPEALLDFFTSLPPVGTTDYILFEVAGGAGVGTGAWCASNAAFYVQSYLENAVTGGATISGSWDRYVRAEGGQWSGPDFSSYANYFGLSCGDYFGWCGEWGIGGLTLGVQPAPVVEETIAGGLWGGNGEALTIAVGPNRLAACGF